MQKIMDGLKKKVDKRLVVNYGRRAMSLAQFGTCFFIVVGFFAPDVEAKEETRTSSAVVSKHAKASRFAMLSNTGSQWVVTASVGYTNYQDMYRDDGQTQLLRLSIGDEMLSWQTKAFFGLELGAQTGNTMRFFGGMDYDTLQSMGGLPFQTTVTPMLDLLATARTAPFSESSFFGQAKAGIAWRQWRVTDRTSVNDVSNIAGELQVGLGMAVSQKISMSVMYQGIFGGNPDLRVNIISENGYSNGTGHLRTIPIQNGVLLSLTCRG